jgi:hypothetical protein
VSRLRSDEGGFALVTAVLLMTIMLGTALAITTTSDSLQRESGITRTRETVFNAAETALSTQVSALGSLGWPAAQAWPQCTPTATDSRCPTAANMRNAHATADTRTGFTWQTSVRDDTGAGANCVGGYYNEATMAGAPMFDANGNGCLWVRAQATTRGRTRTLVALVRAQQAGPSLPPDYAVYAGRVDFDSNAIKQFVQGAGGKVAARCTPASNETRPCAGYRLGSNRAKTIDQLRANFSASVESRDAAWGVNVPTMTAADRERWRARAQAAGTYYTTCPASLTGAVVWIEGNLTCSYSGTTVWNSPAAPGLLIVNGGKLVLGGSVVFHGIIYMPNPTNRTDKIFDQSGNPRVVGSIIADGPAEVNVGTSGQGNITYVRSYFDVTRLPGSAGIVQNTWRELNTGS